MFSPDSQDCLNKYEYVRMKWAKKVLKKKPVHFVIYLWDLKSVFINMHNK